MAASRIYPCASMLSALLCGCLGPNPLLDAGGDETATTGDSSTGDGDGDNGDGDGDGDGDGAASCSNQQLDDDESDVDCGGSCSPCDDGSACGDGSDCASQICSDSTCQVARCDDAVLNGDELEVDCGGACQLCLHGSFVTELDDFEASDALHPSVAMFDDGSFALTYLAPMQARARWFDPLGQPLGPSVELDSTITPLGGRAIPLFAGSGQAIHALEAGQDPESSSTDLFLVQRSPAEAIAKIRVNPVEQLVTAGDLTVEASVATLTWAEYQQIQTRRLDYDVGAGGWVDIEAFAAETMPDSYIGMDPVIARNSAGVNVVAWTRCADGGADCRVAVRRFDAGWIDPAPVAAPGVPVGNGLSDVRVAIADDGRVAVSFTTIGLGETTVMAWMLDAELVSAGPAWMLQANIPSATASDVAALSDGSFAFVWPDTGQARVHLRRFVGPNTPKLPELGDESPWAAVDTPRHTALAGIDGRLVVVWSAQVDGIAQVQGQVLSY